MQSNVYSYKLLLLRLHFHVHETELMCVIHVQYKD